MKNTKLIVVISLLLIGCNSTSTMKCEGDCENGYGTKFWGQTENPEHINNKYIGEWRNDNMHGNGKYEWTDGSYYEGPWENGEQH